MDIQVFVFNYAYFANAMTLFNAFTELGYDTYLLNCESPRDPPFEQTDKILKFPNIYYSGQWNEALKIANKDVMFLINSDVKVNNPFKLMNRMKSYFARYEKAAIYAPNFWWTPWTYNPQLLHHLGDNIRKVPMTDSTVWALKTDLAQKTGAMPLDINNLGWGIEILAAYYAYLEGKYIARDYGVKLEHPQATAYDRGLADRQFRSWIKKLKLDNKFWEYYNSRNKYGFGWNGNDNPVKDKFSIKLN